MSPKRFSQYIANLCPVPARAVLAALGLFVGLAALVSLLLLLSSGAAPVTAAPVEEPRPAAGSLFLLAGPGLAPAVAAPVEEPEAAAASPAPALAGLAEGTDLPSAEAAPAVSVLLAVKQTQTTITSDDPDPSVVGQGVYVRFQVLANNATVTPYGWVTVTNGINHSCSQHCLPTDSYCPDYWYAWWWGCTITPDTVGAQTITATFQPLSTTIYSGSFDTDSHTVNKANTDTAIASGPPGAKACDTIVLTATVTVKAPGSGTPTGTVDFLDGDVYLGTGTLSSGKATYTVSSLSGGQHFFIASYSGDNKYNPSDSWALPIKPASLTPSVGLSVSPASPPMFGTAITLTATITGTTCVTPTGHVYFNDNGVVIGTGAVTTTNRTATLVVPLLSAGSHVLKAVYESDNDAYLDSESPSQTYVIDRRSTTTTLVSSASLFSVWGQQVTFTATVSSGITVTPTGQVLFWDGGTVIGSGTLDGSGRAVISTADLEVGDHPMTADYRGDENFLPDSDSLTQTVNRADTTTLVVGCVPNSSRYGESVTCTARVTPIPPGAGIPTGQITFNVDTTPKYTTNLGLLNPGEASYTTSPGDATTLKPAGGRTVTATYGGDNHFTCTTCTSPDYDQQVLRANTKVDLQAPLTTVEFGQQVKITAIVSVVQPGAGTITGKMVFSVNATPAYTETLDGTTASATYSTNTLPIGANNVCAQYLYDTNPNFNDSAQVCVTITVNRAQTKTSLTSAPNPSDFGQTAVFTATVIPAGASTSAITPTETVTFTFNSTGYMTGTLNSLGMATVTTDTLPAGIYDVTADYGGDGNFLPSSVTRQHTVNRNSTTTTLSSSHSPTNTSVIGAFVTFTATVTGSIVTTGTVSFFDGTTVLDTKTLDASGQATLTKSDLSAGLHVMKAVYNGTPNFQASSSGRLYHTVTAAGSNTALTMPPSSVFGQTVTFTATVTAGGAPVTSGQVTFKYDATTLCSLQPLNLSGQAICTTASLPVDTHTIKARFEGNADYGPSEDTETYTVYKADTTTSITSDDPDSSVVGQPVLVEFTVTADSPGSGNPTGDVTVSDGTDSCTGSVGSAGSCTLIPTTIGNKTLEAAYAGDDNFNETPVGEEGTASHEVISATTTTEVTTSPPSSLPNDPVTITANVTAQAESTATPTGDVQFFDDLNSNGSFDGEPTDKDLGTKTLDGTGQAEVSTTSLAALGPHTIIAEYLGSSNFFGSKDSTTHNVSDIPADLSVTKADSPDPVNVGDDLTYIIVVTNHGPESTDVTLTDTLPSQVTFGSVDPASCGHSGGTVTCDLGTFNKDDYATVTIVVNVPLTTPAGTVLRNTAQVSGTRPDPDLSNNTSTEETTVYRSPRLGDCNGDDTVSLADIWSIVRDIFDPTFQGTSGCDANKDNRVDAGDVPSTVLIMVNGARSQGRRGADSLVPFFPAPLLLCSSAPLPGPALTMPAQVSAAPGGLATVPVTFDANGHSITSLAFSVDYDETWLALDPTDHDGNGIPDAVVFGLPGDFTASVTFDGGDSDGEVDIFIGDISPPLTSLSDGPIAFMILDAGSSPGSTQGAVLFSLDPSASFGDTSGQSIPGTATPTGRYPHQIYLPMVVR